MESPVPRRSRTQLHPLRKRVPPAPVRERRERVEPAHEEPAEILPDELAAPEAAPATAPYIRRRPLEVPARPLTGAAATQAAARPSRGLFTDYGYVVSELQRIGITFAGLIVLLIILTRLLH